MTGRARTRRPTVPSSQAARRHILKVADLVEDDPAKRDKVVSALKDPAQRNNRDHVDIILALGMAKEGFDWIWCEHALTVGYRASLTEIVQIIGRATRDAPGKTAPSSPISSPSLTLPRKRWPPQSTTHSRRSLQAS